MIVGIVGVIVASYWCRRVADRHAERRRVTGLVARANREHQWVLAADPPGTYGEFPPATYGESPPATYGERRRKIHHSEIPHRPAPRPWRRGRGVGQGSTGLGTRLLPAHRRLLELPNHYQKLTGLENLRFFASLYDGAPLDPMELLDAVGLADDANMRVGKYSKGMQMRLTFARSLINDPELLYLDEPTSGLDPVNARKVKNVILDLKSRGRTVFRRPMTWRRPTSCATG